MLEQDAARLVGGMIYLHQKKSEPSYAGGRIEAYREVQADLAHSRRIVLTFTSMAREKGVRWKGASYSMAWTRGVIEDG